MLVKTNPLRLRADLPESAVAVVKAGATLTFTTGAAPGETFTAVVRQLNPSVDQKSRTLVVEARIPKNDPRLRPGMFVQVQLSLQKGSEVVMVPKDAIYTVAGLNKMFVIREGRAVEQKITPGEELDGWIEVPGEAVAPGERVATSGLTQLVTGTPVKTVGAQAKAD
jgi:RND family efflux transporter MFP subunit